jgi:HAD superfamily hydrolase (TIGR01509 family)
MVPELIIFDCDGVLVDSEPISLAVMLEVLREAGCEMTEEQAWEQFLGRSIGTVGAILRDKYAMELTADHLDQLRLKLYARFRNELRPINKVSTAIRGLDAPICVASSSQPDRINLSLGLTGLADLFGAHVFSASMVTRGKPAPDLFLYAAGKMGVPPENCVVIEDSAAGIKAAQAAGMRVIAFTGGSHAVPAGLDAMARANSPSAILRDMQDLGSTIQSLT